MEDMGGQRQVANVKEGIKELRTDIYQSRLSEGLMMNSIFNYKLQLNEKGRNYLYDEIDTQDAKEEAAFTEADLAHPATPSKKKEENFNPYIDSELSATIGKLSKSIGTHKSINIDKFQKKPKPKETKVTKSAISTSKTRPP